MTDSERIEVIKQWWTKVNDELLGPRVIEEYLDKKAVELVASFKMKER